MPWRLRIGMKHRRSRAEVAKPLGQAQGAKPLATRPARVVQRLLHYSWMTTGKPRAVLDRELSAFRSPLVGQAGHLSYVSSRFPV